MSNYNWRNYGTGDEHTGNGVRTAWSTTFPVFDTQHIKVLVGGVENTEWTATLAAGDAPTLATVTMDAAPGADVAVKITLDNMPGQAHSEFANSATWRGEAFNQSYEYGQALAAVMAGINNSADEATQELQSEVSVLQNADNVWAYLSAADLDTINLASASAIVAQNGTKMTRDADGKYSIRINPGGTTIQSYRIHTIHRGKVTNSPVSIEWLDDGTWTEQASHTIREITDDTGEVVYTDIQWNVITFHSSQDVDIRILPLVSHTKDLITGQENATDDRAAIRREVVAADNRITADFTTADTAATNDRAAIRRELATEGTARLNADNALTGRIDNETHARTTEDTRQAGLIAGLDSRLVEVEGRHDGTDEHGNPITVSDHDIPTEAGDRNVDEIKSEAAIGRYVDEQVAAERATREAALSSANVRINENAALNEQQNESLTAINDKNTEQDGRLTALEGATHGADITALTNRVGTNEQSITDLETADTGQNERITTIETGLTTQTNRITDEVAARIAQVRDNDLPETAAAGENTHSPSVRQLRIIRDALQAAIDAGSGGGGTPSLVCWAGSNLFDSFVPVNANQMLIVCEDINTRGHYVLDQGANDYMIYNNAIATVTIPGDIYLSQNRIGAQFPDQNGRPDAEFRWVWVGNVEIDNDALDYSYHVSLADIYGRIGVSKKAIIDILGRVDSRITDIEAADIVQGITGKIVLADNIAAVTGRNTLICPAFLDGDGILRIATGAHDVLGLRQEVDTEMIAGRAIRHANFNPTTGRLEFSDTVNQAQVYDGLDFMNNWADNGYIYSSCNFTIPSGGGTVNHSIMGIADSDLTNHLFIVVSHPEVVGIFINVAGTSATRQLFFSASEFGSLFPLGIFNAASYGIVLRGLRTSSNSFTLYGEMTANGVTVSKQVVITRETAIPAGGLFFIGETSTTERNQNLLEVWNVSFGGGNPPAGIKAEEIPAWDFTSNIGDTVTVIHNRLEVGLEDVVVLREQMNQVLGTATTEQPGINVALGRNDLTGIANGIAVADGGLQVVATAGNNITQTVENADNVITFGEHTAYQNLTIMPRVLVGGAYLVFMEIKLDDGVDDAFRRTATGTPHFHAWYNQRYRRVYVTDLTTNRTIWTSNIVEIADIKANYYGIGMQVMPTADGYDAIVFFNGRSTSNDEDSTMYVRVTTSLTNNQIPIYIGSSGGGITQTPNHNWIGNMRHISGQQLATPLGQSALRSVTALRFLPVASSLRHADASIIQLKDKVNELVGEFNNYSHLAGTSGGNSAWRTDIRDLPDLQPIE